MARQRERLLELIRRLAEDDKDGVMADKVLKLFWTLAHSSDASTDIMDQALAAHVNILDYSCTQYREQQKSRWLDKCREGEATRRGALGPRLGGWSWTRRTSSLRRRRRSLTLCWPKDTTLFDIESGQPFIQMHERPKGAT